MMVRVEDPLVPRATFGILNTLLFFPSRLHLSHQGISHLAARIAYIDPFTYAVHGFKALLLKDAGFVAIRRDLVYLVVSAAIMITDRHRAVQADAVSIDMCTYTMLV